MRYLSSFYWQPEEQCAASLVLQQFVYRKDKQPGLFACIGTGQNCIVEDLAYWFQTKGQKLFLQEKKEEAYKTRKNLEHLFRQLYGDGIMGLICQGERFLLFFRGTGRVYLVNRRFGKENCKLLTPQEPAKELQMISGRMETGIGLLLATPEFIGNLTKQQMEECLSTREIIRTGNVKGRLRELGEEAARKGGCHMGAVMLLTAEGEEL